MDASTKHDRPGQEVPLWLGISPWEQKQHSGAKHGKAEAGGAIPCGWGLTVSKSLFMLAPILARTSHSSSLQTFAFSPTWLHEPVQDKILFFLSPLCQHEVPGTFLAALGPFLCSTSGQSCYRGRSFAEFLLRIYKQYINYFRGFLTAGSLMQ